MLTGKLPTVEEPRTDEEYRTDEDNTTSGTDKEGTDTEGTDTEGTAEKNPSLKICYCGDRKNPTDQFCGKYCCRNDEICDSPPSEQKTPTKEIPDFLKEAIEEIENGKGVPWDSNWFEKKKNEDRRKRPKLV